MEGASRLARENFYEKGATADQNRWFRAISGRSIGNRTFLAGEGQDLGERTTDIAILFAIAGMGVFLYFA